MDGEAKTAVLSVVEHVLQEKGAKGGMVLMHDLCCHLPRDSENGRARLVPSSVDRPHWQDIAVIQIQRERTERPGARDEVLHRE